jgi:Lon protease-like protein
MPDAPVHYCQGCGHVVEQRFRYCPWCAAPLRRKLVEFFAPHPDIADEGVRALRVSRYLDEPAQTRLSVWDGSQAIAAVSLDRGETSRLARYLAATDACDPGADTRPMPAIPA